MGKGKTAESNFIGGGLWIAISIVLFCFFIFAILLPPFGQISAAKNTKKLNDQLDVMRSLIVACKAYEKDRGQFPDRLKELLDEKYIDDTELLETTLTETGEPKPLVYWSGAPGASASETPVIWTPEPFGRKFVAAYLDGSVATVRADRIEEKLGESDGSIAG